MSLYHVFFDGAYIACADSINKFISATSNICLDEQQSE